MSRLSRDELDRGVVAYSSGNHAQAVALAASLLGCPAVIVMPEDAPASKLAATKGYGAEIVPYDRYAEDREAIGRGLAEERGLTLVPPYEDPLIMAGQGTAALELVRDVPDLDDLVTPISGGGLIAGSATAGKGVVPGLRVTGVEPEAGDDTRRSLAEGRRVELPVPRTIADGLQAADAGPADVRGQPAAGGRRGHRLGRRDRRRHAPLVRAPEGRRRAERRGRRGRAPGRADRRSAGGTSG